MSLEAGRVRRRQRRRHRGEGAREGLHGSSATAVAAESFRTGILPWYASRRRQAWLAAAQTMLVGDPDDDWLANEYVGDETPGGSAPTPDQSVVDEIGRAYGLIEEDVAGLRCASEILDRRDRRRAELQPPRRRTI